MANNKIQNLEISRYQNNAVITTPDFIALEDPLEIRLGHTSNALQTLSITMCTAHDIADLVYGYLFTETIIKHANNIINIKIFDNELGWIVEILLDKSINYKEFLNKRHGMVHASCGICGKTEFEDLLTFNYPQIKSAKIVAKIIQSLPAKLNQLQKAFKQTGGLHASALFNAHGELILLKEDIGRHNAMDKLIGAALQQGLLPLDDYIILLSGRISFELVHKALIARISTLAAIGAPSSLSIEIAKLNGLNLLGFIKSDGFNAY